MNKPRIAVIMGGKSVEHEISIISALQAYHAIDKNKYDVFPIYISKEGEFYHGEKLRYMESFKNIPELLKSCVKVALVKEGNHAAVIKYPASMFQKAKIDYFDVAVPVVHGTNVEDGALQGFLEYLDIAYACPDVTSSAVGMDKWLCKCLLKAEGIPVVEGIKMSREEFFKDRTAAAKRIEEALGYPIIVKPYNLGSSIGISRAKDWESLVSGVENALRFSKNVLCEKAVQNLREINCSVLGDEQEAMASVCEEPLNATDILTFADKYTSGSKSTGMESAKRRLPAELKEGQTEEIQRLAVKAFKALGLSGVCRIDFLLNDETGEIYVNEPNTIPGSLSFYLWEASGINFTELMDRLINLALKKYREKKKTVFSFESNVLSMQGGSKGKA